jgi:hypothetical protein
MAISPCKNIPLPSGPLCLITSSIFLTEFTESFPEAPAIPHIMTLFAERFKKGSVQNFKIR